MKGKLKWLTSILAMFALFTIGACSTMSLQGLHDEITVYTPKAPSLIPLVLAADEDDHVHVETWDTVEELIALVQGGEVPFVAAPLNIGANLAAQGFPIELIHINTWGSMYLVSTSQTITQLDDLAGETIYMPGQGGPPDLLTQFILRENGIADQVEYMYVPVPELMQLLASGKAEHAVLPEPVLSGLHAQRSDVVDIIDFNEEWNSLQGTLLPQTGVFVNRNWAENNRETVVWFQTRMEKVVEQLEHNPEKAVDLVAEYFQLPEDVLLQSIERMDIGFKDSIEAKNELDLYFRFLEKVYPDAIGGGIPSEDFYYDF